MLSCNKEVLNTHLGFVSLVLAQLHASKTHLKAFKGKTATNTHRTSSLPS